MKCPEMEDPRENGVMETKEGGGEGSGLQGRCLKSGATGPAWWRGWQWIA